MIPRLITIIGITAVLRSIVPQIPVWLVAIAVAWIQSILFAPIQRATFRDHFLGIAAYRQRNFDQALAHFQASLKKNLDHPFFDSHRAWIGVASKKSYRQVAVLNLGYCHAMLSDGEKAAECFGQVLKDLPGDSNAAFGLNMLRANIPAARQGSAQADQAAA